MIENMEEYYYFEGSETFFADILFDTEIDENVENAVWISQR
ncbi:hypothetical protein [Sinanaerobacter chloroacetimidivorans]|nr:hypothetical protein [Sinanaerobacter chloroacetimidivorans]